MQERFIDEIEEFARKVTENKEQYIAESKVITEKRIADLKVKNEEAKKHSYEANPDYIEFWNPGMENGLLWSKIAYDENETCETCGNTGCYRLVGDHNSPGVCLAHLIEHVGEGRDVLKMVKLPYGHQYDDAMTDDEAEDEYQ